MGIVVDVCQSRLVHVQVEPAAGAAECPHGMAYGIRVESVAEAYRGRGYAVLDIEAAYRAYLDVPEDAARVDKVIGEASGCVQPHVFCMEVGFRTVHRIA